MALDDCVVTKRMINGVCNTQVTGTTYPAVHTIFSTLYSVGKLNEIWIKFVPMDEKVLKWMKL
jgi:hypothetical protein